MDASTRLYARLGQIPEDPNDPESLDELIVCAFGAFERYYLCWRTKSGDFRQDGYDIPSALSDWLNPNEGTTRDWASLQVVFGRGEEYFASDKNGKLEFKGPEVKKPAGEEGREKSDRQVLRRSRTVSFLRPLSRSSSRPDSALAEGLAMDSRTSSISSQRASRPSSLTHFTKVSEALIALPTQMQLKDIVSAEEPSPVPQVASLVSNTPVLVGSTVIPAVNPTGSETAPTATPTQAMSPTSPRTITPLSTASQYSPETSDHSGFASIPEEKAPTRNIFTNIKSEGCKCGCHDPPLSPLRPRTYTDASVQTESVLPPSRTALRVDTMSALSWRNSNCSAISQDVQTPVFENSFCAAPFSMGRMTNYFNKPGYQLGDSLASGYHYYEQPVYHYQDEFGDEALR